MSLALVFTITLKQKEWLRDDIESLSPLRNYTTLKPMDFCHCFCGSHEEYELLLQYQEAEEITCHNTICNVLKLLGWSTLIVGFLLGASVSFLKKIAYLVWSIAIVSGVSFLGFGEIIKLMNRIANWK